MLLALEAPDEAVAEFALLFAVILLGPILVARARIPAIIGFLLGGFAIGSHGLGWIGAGNATIPELGQLGLLYLMFTAGLELDLNLLARVRRAAITFGLLTFTLPFLAGTAVGLGQGWELPESMLLGSLIGSHTLLLYPAVRDAGRGSNPAVATAVGATVLADTTALVILACVAGTATGSGSTTAILGQIAVGLVLLGVIGLIVLPRVALFALRAWGGDRAARYLINVVGFLAMAALGEVFGIEGIVGAFVAGVGLNRLVPNEGPSMERFDFFGSAVLVPVFLVSVGLLLDPSVMFTAETLGLAGLLCVACLGGKAVAAALARPVLGFTGAESGVMFALTVPQAAATLAATLVGFQIGLFGNVVVNAALVLILVSIVIGTIAVSRFVAATPVPDPTMALGHRLLLVTSPTGPSPAARWITEHLVSAHAGVVELVVIHPRADLPDTATLTALEVELLRGQLDGTVRAVVDDDPASAIADAALANGSSGILVDTTDLDGWPADWAERLRQLAPKPTLVVAGRTGSPIDAVDGVDGIDGGAPADDSTEGQLLAALEPPRPRSRGTGAARLRVVGVDGLGDAAAGDDVVLAVVRG